MLSRAHAEKLSHINILFAKSKINVNNIVARIKRCGRNLIRISRSCPLNVPGDIGLICGTRSMSNLVRVAIQRNRRCLEATDRSTKFRSRQQPP